MSLATAFLKDMCELVVDCPHFTPEWTTAGYIVIRNQNIRDGRLDLSDPSYTHKQDFDRRNRRAKPQSGDIVFTREAPMGEACIVPEGLECCIGQRQVLLRPKKGIDSRYLLYALRSRFVRHQIFWNEGTGSTVSNVRIPVLEALKIPRLGAAEKEIGDLLGVLDDKIDLNRRMNATLEALTRLIFKDWFVDFGPTRGRMERRAPYLAPELWALFPERLDADGKPEGWEIAKLGILCARVAMGPFGSDITTDNFVASGVPVIRGGNLKDGFIDDNFVYVTDTKADALRNANAFAQDIVITHRGTLGQVGIIPKKPTYSRYVVSQSQMLLAADTEKTTPRFIFEFLRSEAGMQQLLAFTSQVGVPAIARPTTSLKSLDVIAPPQPVGLAFDHLLAPLVDREITNTLEARSLGAVRDLLLPKLMSGKISIKEAEKVAEAAL